MPNTARLLWNELVAGNAMLCSPKLSHGNTRLFWFAPESANGRVEPAQVFPVSGAPPNGRPRVDGVIGWSRIRWPQSAKYATWM
jgi:hypothetical protein